MQTARKLDHAFIAKEALEGAGVRLHRGFAQPEVPRFDPFLLFDDFSSKDPVDYLPGFPWHPHRGIETVTYILNGAVRHHDSIGNEGVIRNGEVQWMTAGGGIIHEEMPQGTGGIQGFQLWVNLPEKHKMMRPRYQEVQAKIIPEIPLGPHAKAKVVAGQMGKIKGPVEDIMAEPLYLDITLDAEKTLELPVQDGHTVFAYIWNGALGIGKEGKVEHKPGTVLLFERTGDQVALRAGAGGARFLLVSGKPIGEPVAWYGPIVMNTKEELQEAYRDLQEGSFVTRAK